MARPPLVYRFLRGLVRGLVGVFFREIAVEGAANVPRDRGGLLVAWHPNGIVDPALILASAPVQVVFGARDGLLRWPVVGWLMRRLGTVPIYRAQDTAGPPSPEARRAANDASLGALAGAVLGRAVRGALPRGRQPRRAVPVGGQDRRGAALPEGARRGGPLRRARRR